jgi:hypothetical protein
MSRRPWLPIAVAVLGLPVALAGAAGKQAPGTAAGTLTIDGKAVKLTHAYALLQPNTFEKEKMDTVVLLTDTALPPEALKVEDLERATRGLKNAALFAIDATGRPQREVVRHAALGDNVLQVSGFTRAKFSGPPITAERIEGSFATKAEEDFMSHKYTLSVSFNADVVKATLPEPLPNTQTGQKLPPGGGDPGKAYLAVQAAIQKKDLAAVRKMKPADAPDLPDEQLKAMLELMAAMTPKNVKITEGYVKGDVAALHLVGTGEDGKAKYGTVEVRRAGGTWRAGSVSWSDQPPKK